MTANTFGFHSIAVSKVVHHVYRAISDYLGPKYLKISATEDEMIEKVSEFEAKYVMPFKNLWISSAIRISFRLTYELPAIIAICFWTLIVVGTTTKCLLISHLTRSYDRVNCQ